MGGLLTLVILIEAGKLTLQVMALMASRRRSLTALPRSCSLSLICCLLTAQPPVPHTVEPSSDLILPSAESWQQEEISRVLEARMSNGRDTPAHQDAKRSRVTPRV